VKKFVDLLALFFFYGTDAGATEIETAGYDTINTTGMFYADRQSGVYSKKPVAGAKVQKAIDKGTLTFKATGKKNEGVRHANSSNICLFNTYG